MERSAIAYRLIKVGNSVETSFSRGFFSRSEQEQSQILLATRIGSLFAGRIVQGRHEVLTNTQLRSDLIAYANDQLGPKSDMITAEPRAVSHMSEVCRVCVDTLASEIAADWIKDLDLSHLLSE